jgi:hypothetical protein
LSEADVGSNERFREYRISHFRLQTRRERNCGGGFIGTFSIRGLGEGDFSALSIHSHCGWRLSSVVHRFGSCKTDLESRRRSDPCESYTGALDGSAEMNVWLHKQVMAKLAESGGKVPDSLKA